MNRKSLVILLFSIGAFCNLNAAETFSIVARDESVEDIQLPFAKTDLRVKGSVERPAIPGRNLPTGFKVSKEDEQKYTPEENDDFVRMMNMLDGYTPPAPTEQPLLVTTPQTPEETVFDRLYTNDYPTTKSNLRQSRSNAGSRPSTASSSRDSRSNVNSRPSSASSFRGSRSDASSRPSTPSSFSLSSFSSGQSTPRSSRSGRSTPISLVELVSPEKYEEISNLYDAMHAAKITDKNDIPVEELLTISPDQAEDVIGQIKNRIKAKEKALLGLQDAGIKKMHKEFKEFPLTEYASSFLLLAPKNNHDAQAAFNRVQNVPIVVEQEAPDTWDTMSLPRTWSRGSSEVTSHSMSPVPFK